MRAETQNIVAEIEKSLNLLGQRMDIDTAQHRLEELNARVEDPKLWDDPAAAQKLMRDRQMLVDAMETYESIRTELKDNVELIELGEMEEDAEVVSDAEAALSKLARMSAQKELEALPQTIAGDNTDGLQGRTAIRRSRRRGGDQVRGLQDLRPQCLWLAEIGKRRAPAGADFALWQGHAGDLLCQRMGLSGGR